MRIWIDIANAPHATLFSAWSRVLSARGHDLVVTGWDRGQTGDLVLRRWPDATLVGPSGFRSGARAKALATFERTRRLRRLLGHARVDVALSHGSYPQLAAARSLGLPSITLMDYEHQPANHVAFRVASRVVLPAAVSLRDARRAGADASKVRFVPWLKEEVALSDFVPDDGFRAAHGIDDGPVAVVRPAPTGALYHRGGNPLLDGAVGELARRGVTVLVSPRTPSQAAAWHRPGVRVLERAVSGPDLLHTADLFIGGGGTMTREAAVLGTPTLAAFAGRVGAVDHELVRRGRMRLLASFDDLPRELVRAHRSWSPDRRPAEAATDTVEQLASELA